MQRPGLLYGGGEVQGGRGELLDVRGLVGGEVLEVGAELVKVGGVGAEGGEAGGVADLPGGRGRSGGELWRVNIQQRENTLQQID